MSEKQYIYCNVLPENYQTPYYYIADTDIKAGDIVIVSIRHKGKEMPKVGLVLDAIAYSKANAPYPVEYTKHILRIFGENDAKDKDLAAQKARLEVQNAHLLLSEEQKFKKQIKEGLVDRGIYRKENAQTSLYFQNLIRNAAASSFSSTSVSAEFSGGIMLSEDGKTVVQYIAKHNKNPEVVIIPSGVEKIEDAVFNKAKFTKLVINKELKELGQYTLYNKGYNRGPNGYYLKSLQKIEVESGNEIFSADEHALYKTLEDGTKELVFLYDTSVKCYETPKGVSSIASDAFQLCDNLEYLSLGENIREFNEYSLYEWHKLKSIYIHKNVEKIIARGYPIGLSNGSVLYYEIDEENPFIFKDEDCIYQVLEDGTYKLIVCNYYGKGAPIISDNTSVIGSNAFYGCEGFSKIDIPKSVKTIERYAFGHTKLSSVTIPSSVKVLEEYAFGSCDELKKITINHEIEQIDENAFMGCSWDLKKITSTSKTPLYSFKDGVIRKVNEQKKAPSATENMQAIAKKLNGWCFSDSTTEKAVYNASNNSIELYFDLVLKSDNAALVKERVECAETISVNDEVVVKNPDIFTWEIFAKNGRSLGELNFLFVRQIRKWYNLVKVQTATITKVTPRSMRKGAKYALVSVKIILVPNEINQNLTKEEKEFGNTFAYRIDKDEAVVLAWIGQDDVKKVTIPSTLEGKKIKKLCKGLFRWGDDIGQCNIEELIISEGIETIEEESLFGLDKLKKIVFPQSVKFISNDVFSQIDGENNYRDLYLKDDTVFIAPKGSYAEEFLIDYKPDIWRMEALTVVNDDSKDTQNELKIQNAFEFKRSGNGFSATFKDGWQLDGFREEIVRVPDKYNGQPIVSFDISSRPAFIKKLILPATIEVLENIDTTVMFYTGRGADHCLDEIEVEAGNQRFWSDGKAIYSKDKKRLYRMLSYHTTEYTVQPETVIVEKFAFGELINLKTITLSPSTKEVKDHAFSDCTSLEDINGMENVSVLGNNLFDAYGWGAKDIPYLKKNNVMLAGNNLMKYQKVSEVSYTVPDSIELIDKNAFYVDDENDCLEELIISDSVKTIRNGAFSGRKKLKKVVLSNSLKEIEANLFSNCLSLRSLYIPASVEKIDISAFPRKGFVSEGTAFASIEVDPQNPNYSSVNGMLLSKDKKILYYVPGQLDLASNLIPLDVQEIGQYAAAYNATKDEFELPIGLVKIGEGAFSHMENLVKVSMPHSLIEVEKYAFNQCSKLSSVVWSNFLETIGDSAFAKTELVRVDLPSSLISIGTEAFAETKMQKAKLPKSVKTIGWGVFSGCKEIEVYDSVDPNAKDCDEAIDTINGNPNSNVGYIGIGPAWAMWQCAANHRWYDYSIVVRSAETDEVKYEVWMGADSTQRQYYCQLSSSWGRNATFSFKALDEFFPKIRGTDHKVKVARLRLKYPVELADEMKKKYESYLSRYGKEA